MFQVLVFVYENYGRGDDCPAPSQLGRKLSAVGFEQDEIAQALDWLQALRYAAQDSDALALAGGRRELPAARQALRVYSAAEREHLGAQCLGFVHFLESAGMLPPAMREIVLDRAMAAPGAPVALADLKVIVLMVYWSMGTEPDALVLDELCQDTAGRVAH